MYLVHAHLPDFHSALLRCVSGLLMTGLLMTGLLMNLWHDSVHPWRWPAGSSGQLVELVPCWRMTEDFHRELGIWTSDLPGMNEQ